VPELPDVEVYVERLNAMCAGKHLAAVRVVRGREAVAQLEPGGLEPLTATLQEFAAVLVRNNHTLKRALTDLHISSGIGNSKSRPFARAWRYTAVSGCPARDAADG